MGAGRRFLLRRFALIAVFSGTSFQLFSCAQNRESNEMMLFVGTYTSGDSEGVYAYKFNPETGDLKFANKAAAADPSFLAIHPNGRFLYAVNELLEFDGRPTGTVSAFSVDENDGGLTLLNQIESQGGAPCHISLDRTGKWALVANYVSGTIASFPILEDGSLGEAASVVQHEGSSVNPKRQEGPHAHQIFADASNKFVFATDLGLDKILIYRFDAATGALSPNAPPFVETEPGAGPRHFALHPELPFGYVINELNSTITRFDFDGQTGALTRGESVSTLPDDFEGDSYCADVHISPDGRFLYGSNRGHNSIVVCEIAQDSGKLTPIQHISTEGEWPRNFTIDPTGKFLLVANQHTNNIAVLKIDQASGKLSSTGKNYDIPTPVCLQFLTP